VKESRESGGFDDRQDAAQSTVAAAIVAHRMQQVFQAFPDEVVGLTGKFGFRHFDESFDQAGMDAARLGDAEISATANIDHDQLSLEGLSSGVLLSTRQY